MKKLGLAKNGLPLMPNFPGTWIQENYETMTNLAMAQDLGISLRSLEKKLMRMRRDGYLPTGPKKRVTKSSTKGPVISINIPDTTNVVNYIEKTLGQNDKPSAGETGQEVRVRDTDGRVVGFWADSSSIEDGMLHLWVEREGYQPYIVATWAPGTWVQVWTVGLVALHRCYVGPWHLGTGLDRRGPSLVTAIVRPSEDEMALLSILMDPTGIDLAEFALIDQRNDDNCYRLHDYQWSWFADDDMYQIDHSGRNIGKTESIKLRCLAFPFARPGKSMLITAPELNHLRPLTDEVEKYLLTCPLTEMMMLPGKSRGIARQPHWQVRFSNGSSVISRLPNNDGRGVKGQHVDQLEMDEGQDYPQAGYREIVEAFNAGNEGAMWRIHGVSKGVRDEFYERTQPNSGWKVHRYMGMHRPTWNDKERREKINQYGGSRQNTDYRRNVYGDHGDVQNPVFVLSRLMACVRTDEGSLYNTEVYTPVKIDYERFPEDASETERQALIDSWIQLPGIHLNGYSERMKNREVGSPKGYSAYWAGMDVGMTTDPSEILVFGQRKGTDLLELLTRVQMHRINADDQKFVIQKIMDFYGTKIQFGIDKTGLGHMLWDELTRYPFGDRVHGFGFGEKRVVGFEDRELTGKETMEDLAMRRSFLEASTDWLRNDYVDSKNLVLPYDREILLEFQGQTYNVVKDSGDPYKGTRRVFGGGTLHTLDAAKVAIATRHIPPLEEMLLKPKVQESVLDYFVG